MACVSPLDIPLNWWSNVTYLQMTECPAVAEDVLDVLRRTNQLRKLAIQDIDWFRNTVDSELPDSLLAFPTYREENTRGAGYIMRHLHVPAMTKLYMSQPTAVEDLGVSHESTVPAAVDDHQDSQDLNIYSCAVICPRLDGFYLWGFAATFAVLRGTVHSRARTPVNERREDLPWYLESFNAHDMNLMGSDELMLEQAEASTPLDAMQR
ncbi:hypothetical protein BDV98DRAFT_596087 [Pterulicium gracile]|uniref:Uncharacterized protein n=1 Tax=Pterulicium gracile TaxID=1884261 RepID=A0A5C3Q928_9AGAR|nr:hypothetical protein BDV98DRAFT_596087 [Pterula gracilis]